MTYNNNPSLRKIQSKLGQIRQLERECIYILIEHPMCFKSKEEKDEMIELAISHIEKKLNRSTSGSDNYASAVTICLSITLQEFQEAMGENTKKQRAKRVTEKLLGYTEAELRIIPNELKTDAFRIASMYLAEL